MTVDSKTDSIIVELVYPHSVERVWAAITSAEALTAWLMPNDFEPHLGHQFTFRTAPGQGWNGTVQCEVVTLDAPKQLAFTWRGSALDTLVTITLNPVEGGTHFRLEHSGFGRSGEAGLTIRDMMASGWDSRILRERLPAYLNELSNTVNIDS